MHFSIEMSQSGKTFGIAFAKKEGEKPFFVLKNCRLASRKDGSGEFVSTPSQKMDDGKYFQLAYLDKNFSDYVLKLAQAAGGVSNSQKAKGGTDDIDTSESIPF